MLKIKQAIYRRLRAEKQLLVIALGEAVRLSLYRQSALQWEESFPYETAAALEACVRDCLLEHDVEENVPALLLLDAGRLQSEQLTLPTLTQKQLRKTLAWEAEQLFADCSYCYKTMAATAASEGAELTTSLQQDAERYAVWHERRAESVQLEQRLAALKQQAQQRKAVTGVSKELEAWGGLRLQGVYLTRLEFKTSQEKQNADALVKEQEKQHDTNIQGKKIESNKQNAAVTVRGVARDEQALDGLLESLQRSSRYSSVQLMQVHRQADATAFSVQTSVAGGK